MKHQESREVGDESATCQSEHGSGKHVDTGNKAGLQRSETTHTVRQSGSSQVWNADMSRTCIYIYSDGQTLRTSFGK